jgi:hypothetical protein
MTAPQRQPTSASQPRGRRGARPLAPRTRISGQGRGESRANTSGSHHRRRSWTGSCQAGLRYRSRCFDRDDSNLLRHSAGQTALARATGPRRYRLLVRDSSSSRPSTDCLNSSADSFGLDLVDTSEAFSCAWRHSCTRSFRYKKQPVARPSRAPSTRPPGSGPPVGPPRPTRRRPRARTADPRPRKVTTDPTHLRAG